MSAFFFGQNPTKNYVSTRRVTSRTSWTDIQCNSSKFTLAMRGSSSTGCNGAKDTPIFSASRNKKDYE
jgi:hypothetical protein